MHHSRLADPAYNPCRKHPHSVNFLDEFSFPRYQVGLNVLDGIPQRCKKCFELSVLCQPLLLSLPPLIQFH